MLCTGNENWAYNTTPLMSYLLQDGLTPLYVASHENHKDVVQLLVASGANLNLARNVRNGLVSNVFPTSISM